jgi:hypothetical protein
MQINETPYWFWSRVICTIPAKKTSKFRRKKWHLSAQGIKRGANVWTHDKLSYLAVPGGETNRFCGMWLLETNKGAPNRGLTCWIMVTFKLHEDWVWPTLEKTRRNGLRTATKMQIEYEKISFMAWYACLHLINFLTCKRQVKRKMDRRRVRKFENCKKKKIIRMN